MKENIEWIRSWCEDTDNKNLPRALLIGDSINEGYQGKVREALKDICCVDYISTSYSVNTNLYERLLLCFENDSEYDIIHFNNGLHGEDIPVGVYKAKIKSLLKKFKCRNMIIATSTRVYNTGNETIDEKWEKRLEKLNIAVKEIAEAEGYLLNDLYEVSRNISSSQRHEDGTHYSDEGYDVFARQVTRVIQEALNNI